MIRESKTLLPNCSGKISFEGEPIKAVGYYSNETNKRLNTISIHTRGFTGRVYLYGTLSLNPTDNDWSIIQLVDGKDYIEYDSLTEGDKKVQKNNIYNITGCYTYLKAKMDRSYLSVFSNLPTYYTPNYTMTGDNVSSWTSSVMNGNLAEIPNNDRINEALRFYGNVEKIMLCY